MKCRRSVGPPGPSVCFCAVVIMLAALLAAACAGPFTVGLGEAGYRGTTGPEVPPSGAPDGDSGRGWPFTRIQITAPEFTLMWDGAESPVAHYRIYARGPGSQGWVLLADELSSPSLRVSTSLLSPGDYLFGVSSVAPDGTESAKHTSMDPTADPPSGWYLAWEPETEDDDTDEDQDDRPGRAPGRLKRPDLPGPRG